jgi:alpha-beta hydrolase superfamily lysophospholipase
VIALVKSREPGLEVFPLGHSAGSTDKTLRLYEDHFHDLLNDVGKQSVMADIVDWIRARLH